MGRLTKFAMLTGTPKAGKSTLARRLAAELGCGLLDNDSEIAGRSFDLLKMPDLKGHIGSPHVWKDVADRYDLARLFRLHYRDWVARNSCHVKIVSPGWLYMRRDDRRQVYDGLGVLTDREWSFALLLLWYPEEERARRYLNHPEVVEALRNMGPAEKRAYAVNWLNGDFRHWEEPRPGGEPVTFLQCESDDQAVRFLSQWFQQAGS